MEVIDFLAGIIDDGGEGYMQHHAAELIERMTPEEWDRLTTDMVGLVSTRLLQRTPRNVQTKRKGGYNRIAGRRNRCHAQPAIILMRPEVQFDESRRMEIMKMVEESCNGSGLWKMMAMNQTDFEVIVPNKFKQPRFLS